MENKLIIALMAVLAMAAPAAAETTVKTITGEVTGSGDRMLRIQSPDGDVHEVHWDESFSDSSRLSNTDEGDHISVEAAQEEGEEWRVREIKEGGSEPSDPERTVRTIAGRITRESDDSLRIETDDGDVFDVRFNAQTDGYDRLRDADEDDRITLRAEENEQGDWHVQSVRSLEKAGESPAEASPETTVTSEAGTDLSGTVHELSGETFILRAADGNNMKVRLNEEAEDADELEDLEEGDQIRIKAGRNQAGEWVVQEVIDG